MPKQNATEQKKSHANKDGLLPGKRTALPHPWLQVGAPARIHQAQADGSAWLGHSWVSPLLIESSPLALCKLSSENGGKPPGRGNQWYP